MAANALIGFLNSVIEEQKLLWEDLLRGELLNLPLDNFVLMLLSEDILLYFPSIRKQLGYVRICPETLEN